jgi:hypothetical protein
MSKSTAGLRGQVMRRTVLGELGQPYNLELR